MELDRLISRFVLCALVFTPLFANAGTTTYGYDSLGRLRTVTAPDASVSTYTYDAAGNRSSISAPGGSGSPITAPTGGSGYSPTRGVVYMSWTASSGGTPPYVYYIESCSGATCTNFTFLKTSSTTSTQATGLAYPATHRFRVRARDAAGTGNYGPYSNIFNVFTQ